MNIAISKDGTRCAVDGKPYRLRISSGSVLIDGCRVCAFRHYSGRDACVALFRRTACNSCNFYWTLETLLKGDPSC